MPDPLSLRTRRAAEARLDALRAEFGEFPVLQVTRINDPEFFQHGVKYFEAGHRGAAGARVVDGGPSCRQPCTDDEGRILLIREARAPGTWVLPGGGHEPGETFAETAKREVWEEAGVECEITGVWRAVLKRFVREHDPARRGYLVELFFTAEPVGGEAAVHPERWDDEADEEVVEARWFDELPENAISVVTEPTAPPRV
jgi:8-oxo-dGTP pyrophosphatase MutT (NUDIX family)